MDQRRRCQKVVATLVKNTRKGIEARTPFHSVPSGSIFLRWDAASDIGTWVNWKSHPDFLFVAEAYWDSESKLEKQGFDFCYDKRLYDRLEHANAQSVRLHPCADLDYHAKLLRPSENHDKHHRSA